MELNSLPDFLIFHDFSLSLRYGTGPKRKKKSKNGRNLPNSLSPKDITILL